MRHDFEIGVVYRNGYGRHYLSVDRNFLVTMVYGNVVECENPPKPYSVIRSVSVEKLCNIWRITLDELDEKISNVYFAPVKTQTKRRLPDKFSSKMDYSQDMINMLWAKHRTHRVSSGAS